MAIRDRLVKDDKNALSFFDYYKAIGCTDNQSLVLSLYTYGKSGYWYNSVKAFDFYYDKYSKSSKEVPFCDYLAEIILSVDCDNIVEALNNAKEYSESEESEKKKRRAELDSLEGCSNYRGFGGLFTRSAPLGMVKKAKLADNDVFASKASIQPMSLSNAVVPESNTLFCASLEDSFDSTCEDSCDIETLETEYQASANITPSRVVEKCIVNQVAEVVMKDFMEKISTDRYEVIEEKGFLSPLTSPTSTFRMTSNTAAFGVLRKNKGRGIDKSMVRIEELLNNFEYKLSKPTKRMFNINTQVCDKPNSNNKLLFVGVQGKDIIPQRQNITLLLDTSGSMGSNNVWTQAAMITIVKQLKDNDVLSLVCYSDNDRTVFENMVIDSNSFDKFIETMFSIKITGCTYGSKGIETAYELANKTYIKDGINRVILMTDGDLNFGITDKGGLKDLILSKKNNGIFLSVLGTGLYNYKDDVLETLSKNGNGNYCTIDCLEDVKENIFDKYNSLVFTIAKDVKAQVEFNPKFVKKYRLIGYENRALNHEDFRNDAVISEPFGCGSYGVALYELEMQDGVSEIKSDLKYQQPTLTDADSICTVSVRYKEPLATESQELSVEVKNKTAEFKDNLLLAYTIMVIGERLRNSNFYNEKDKKFVTDMIYKNGLGDLYEKNFDKFQTLMSFIEK